MEAVGMLEVFGLVCAMVAADAGCKAGNVTIEAMDKNKPANADPLRVPCLLYTSAGSVRAAECGGHWAGEVLRGRRDAPWVTGQASKCGAGTREPIGSRKCRRARRKRAVSYTHLDVYKRQAMGRPDASATAMTSLRPWRSASSSSSSNSRFACASDTDRPRSIATASLSLFCGGRF